MGKRKGALPEKAFLLRFALIVMVLAGGMWYFFSRPMFILPRTKMISGNHFNPDREPDSITYQQLADWQGPVPKAKRKYHLMVLVKFFGSQYWQWMADGMQAKSDSLKTNIDILSASNELDTRGQLALMEAMRQKKGDAFLLSPQTDQNLASVATEARKAGVPIINVADSLIYDAEHYVGPNQYQAGAKAAEFFIKRLPKGGRLAIIKGLPGSYAVRERNKAFLDTLKGHPFEVIASPHADWDMQKAFTYATAILKQNPEINGFYCNNDVMALGVVEAIKDLGKQGKVLVIGTDGIGLAYSSIRAGEMSATVDLFPYLTGQIAVEVALRLCEGQDIPRVVFNPVSIVTLDNIEHPLPGYQGAVHPTPQ